MPWTAQRNRRSTARIFPHRRNVGEGLAPPVCTFLRGAVERQGSAPLSFHVERKCRWRCEERQPRGVSISPWRSSDRPRRGCDPFLEFPEGKIWCAAFWAVRKNPPARESRGRGVAGFCFTSTGLPADREWLPFGRGWRCFWGGGRRLHRSAALRRTPTAWRGRRSRKCSWHHYSSGCSCPRRR